MKKSLIVFLTLVAVFSYSQCKIEGSEELLINTEEEYNVQEINCKNCYSWSASNNSIDLTSKGSIVKVKAVNEGQTTLKLTIKNGKVKSTCEKILIIKSSEDQYKDNTNCILPTSAIKENINQNETVTLTTTEINNMYTVDWIITYNDGTTEKFKEKTNTILLHPTKYITSIKLRISNDLCSKEIEKKYDKNFWIKTEPKTINQLEYKQESYEEYKKRTITSASN